MSDIIELDSTREEKEEKKSGQNPLVRIRKKFEQDESLKNLLSWNELYQSIYFLKPFKYIKAGAEMSDTAQAELLYYISNSLGFDVPNNKLEVAMTVEAMKCIKNPIKDYLERLKWDGTPRLGTWLHRFAGVEQNEYTGAVGRVVLTAAVARIYEPGIKYDYMMILEGRTRIGKSRMLQALGGEWYLDMHLEDTNKDIIDNMRGKWIIEVSEMAGFGKRENDWLKAFLSRSTDRVRLSYGRRSQDYPRQSILIGSMNPSGDNAYFRDDTGNARYWPVECSDKIDVNGVMQNRDNLFAEAMHWYKQRIPLYLTDNSYKLAEDEQQRRLQQDPWYWNIVQKLFHVEEVTASEILEKIGIPLTQRDRYAQMRVGTVMKQLGWIRRQRHTGERYYVKENGILDGGAQDTSNS
jgi:predicted P-loop ATPase